MAENFGPLLHFPNLPTLEGAGDPGPNLAESRIPGADHQPAAKPLTVMMRRTGLDGAAEKCRISALANHEAKENRTAKRCGPAQMTGQNTAKAGMVLE